MDPGKVDAPFLPLPCKLTDFELVGMVMTLSDMRCSCFFKYAVDDVSEKKKVISDRSNP